MVKRTRESDDEVSDHDSEFTSIDAQSPAKIIELEVDQDHSTPSSPSAMQCILPPHHPISFVSAEEFDIHYAKEHTNRCVSCGRNFPSIRYLELHLDEHHNPLRLELASKGEKTYRCFVEGCEKMCLTTQKRRLHLIDKHLFPKNYNFRMIEFGIDQANTMLQDQQRRRVSISSSAPQQRRNSPLSQTVTGINGGAATLCAKPPLSSSADETRPKHDIDQLDKALAALRFVPTSVQARQRKEK